MVKYGYIILMCPIKSLFAHKLHDQKPSGRHGFQQDPDAFEPETQVRRAIPDGPFPQEFEPENPKFIGILVFFFVVVNTD